MSPRFPVRVDPTAVDAAAVGFPTPRGLRHHQHDWDELGTPTVDPAPFDPACLDGLPEPARRYLGHAVAPGAPLLRRARLAMRGHIRLGRWYRFTATQVLAPPEGFVWAATARVHGLPVVGYDRLSSGTGEMCWRAGGLIPVMTATGDDTTRSAAGRLACEGVLVPTAWVPGVPGAPRWEDSGDPDTALAVWSIAGGTESVSVHLGSAGQVRGVVVPRWGDPDGTGYGRHPFGVTCAAERTVRGVTVPTRVRAGWWWGTDRQAEGEFFRATLTRVELR